MQSYVNIPTHNSQPRNSQTCCHSPINSFSQVVWLYKNYFIQKYKEISCHCCVISHTLLCVHHHLLLSLNVSQLLYRFSGKISAPPQWDWCRMTDSLQARNCHLDLVAALFLEVNDIVHYFINLFRPYLVRFSTVSHEFIMQAACNTYFHN